MLFSYSKLGMMLRDYIKHLLDFKSLSWFLIIGGSSALVNLGSFSALWHFLHWPNALSVTVAYFLSVVVHFLGNRYITFRDHKHQPILHNLRKYLVMVFINYLLSLLVVHITVEYMHFYPPLGVCFAIAATVGLGFILSKLWVFKH